jgi:nitrite reductase/ring-hydroxylating ferredoxin subunit
MSQEPAAECPANRSTADASDKGATRRGLLVGTGLAGVAGALAACGGTEPAGGAQAGAGLVKTADVPVGGAKILAEQGVVVAQPQEGTWQAFSSKCTHRGCDVDKVEGNAVVCPCHGSKFSLADGSVAGGPAPKPLEKKEVKVEGEWIKLA